MPTFQERFYTRNEAIHQRLLRVLSLLRWLGGHLIAWCTTGRHLRREYRKAETGSRSVMLEDYLDRKGK